MPPKRWNERTSPLIRFHKRTICRKLFFSLEKCILSPRTNLIPRGSIERLFNFWAGPWFGNMIRRKVPWKEKILCVMIKHVFRGQRIVSDIWFFCENESEDWRAHFIFWGGSKIPNGLSVSFHSFFAFLDRWTRAILRRPFLWRIFPGYSPEHFSQWQAALNPS